MPQLVSTLSASVDYVDYAKSDSGAAKRNRHVTVLGGANVAQKRLVLAGEGASSRAGITTTISDEDLEFLKGHKLFQKHVETGHIKIVAFAEKASKVAKDMAVDNDEGKGGSTPLTVDDTKKGGRIAGTKLNATKVD